MSEVEIRFEREKLEGVVPIGTYLIDAAKRFGIRFDDACTPESDIHFCAVSIREGSNLLSAETKAEEEHFKVHGGKDLQRLACQVKIEKAGEVVVMTEQKVAEEPKVESAEAEADANEQYRKEFSEMPLEKQIANLVLLETIAFGETVSFIFNSPFKIADKVMDVMAEFGFRKEEREKDAARPEEHKAETGDPATEKKSKKKSKSKGSE